MFHHTPGVPFEVFAFGAKRIACFRPGRRINIIAGVYYNRDNESGIIIIDSQLFYFQ